ncbi:hypothetical protein ACEPPN_002527 [Leptodophora sp. 'Broadleaf-Isolate-01']
MASNQSSSSPTNTNDNRNSVNSIAGDATAPAELSAVVDELLNSLSNKFAGVSSEIFAKSKHPIHSIPFGDTQPDNLAVDEMSRRLDNLEATLQSNIDGRDGKSSPTK